MANLRLEQYAGPLTGNVDVPSYISGYVDGEGCFSVSISPRSKLLAGWEVRPSLSVSQNADRSEVLMAIQQYFGCGSLRPDRSDRTLKWEVRSLPLLVQRVIPHFERYPLLSGKQCDFELFAGICRRMVSGDRRRPEQLAEIVAMADRMNPSGQRGYRAAEIIDSLLKVKA